MFSSFTHDKIVSSLNNFGVTNISDLQTALSDSVVLLHMNCEGVHAYHYYCCYSFMYGVHKVVHVRTYVHSRNT